MNNEEVTQKYPTVCPKCGSSLELSKGAYITAVLIKHAMCDECNILWDSYENGRIKICRDFNLSADEECG